MKADLDSIVIIIVSLLFIILGGLSRRRKKKPVMKSNLQYRQPSGQGFKGKDFLSDAVTMINDPFAKLEKIFNNEEQAFIPEGESMESTTGIEQESSEIIPVKKSVSGEVPLENESQSLEEIVDEVSEYLKEKEISKSTIKTDQKLDEHDLTQQEEVARSMLYPKKKTRIPLFENVDDIKKAVIYSEILKRKDY